MRIYYEKGDQVLVSDDSEFLHKCLSFLYQNEKGRTKIVEDIIGSKGIIYAVTDGKGHLEAFYRKEKTTHTWILPVAVFNLPYPLDTHCLSKGLLIKNIDS